MSVTLQTVSSGYNLSAINDNFQSLQTALNDNILWRNGSVAGETLMTRDLDMNGNNILNIGTDLSESGSLITVGQADARYYNITGDELEGTLDASGNAVTGLPLASSPSDATRYSQLTDEASYRASADASLQLQIAEAAPIASAERPIVQWHGQTLENSVIVPDNQNAFSIGPQITIAPGQVVTLGENSYWNILGNVFEADELYNVTANNLITEGGGTTVAVDEIVVDSDLGTMAAQNSNSVSIAGGSITGITDLAIADGGTGASTASAARTNLGLGTLATQSATSVAITGGSVTGITDLAVSDGGTGASTAAAARTNLSAASSGVNSDITQLTGLTAPSPLQGVTDASSAAAGKIGEYVSATTGTAVSLTSNAVSALISVSLTAGDWEVSGVVSLAPSVSVTNNWAAVGTVSGTIDAFPARYQSLVTFSTSSQFPVPSRRINIAATTTVYLQAAAVFASGTCTGQGFIQARRIR